MFPIVISGTDESDNILQQEAACAAPDYSSTSHCSPSSDLVDSRYQLEAVDVSTHASSFEDAPSSRNTIEVLLDSYLAANPDIDAVVVSWDVLYAEWSSPQRGLREPNFNFTPVQTNEHGKLLELGCAVSG